MTCWASLGTQPSHVKLLQISLAGTPVLLLTYSAKIRATRSIICIYISYIEEG